MDRKLPDKHVGCLALPEFREAYEWTRMDLVYQRSKLRRLLPKDWASNSRIFFCFAGL